MNKNYHKTIIIGAGAAGMMTAISARLHGAEDIAIIDASRRIGLKILMSGGGRCNITNADLDFKKYFGESSRAIRKIILQFPPEKMIHFLKENGVKTKVEEPWNKYFPVTDKAGTIVEALLDKLAELNVTILHPVKVNNFQQQSKGWGLSTSEGEFECQNLVMAFGGFSYPHTGSDGTLWPKLKSLGIKVKKDHAALTPIRTSDCDAHELAGVALWCLLKVRCKKSNKVVFQDSNSCLFTHSGMSGPGILNISQWFTGDNPENYQLEVSFLPEMNEEEFRGEFTEVSRKRNKEKVFTYLSEKVPKRLAQMICQRAKLDKTTLGQVSKKQRSAMVQNLFYFTPKISGHFGYKKAEVTAGGIPFSEIQLTNMSIKDHPGLYAVGEVVNVHGVIGGYNFQWAWSSGWICGKCLGLVPEKDTP